MTTVSFAASQTVGTTPPHYRGLDIRATQTGTWSSSVLIVLGLFAFHAGLVLAMHQWKLVATIHGLAIGLIALTVAFSASRAKVAMMGGYITGADVLWRMTGAAVPWEYAKFLIVATFLITLVRRRAEFAWRLAPIAYFFLLIPSVYVLLNDPRLDLEAIRSALSFGLSGPLTLAIAIWLLSQVVLSPAETHKVFILCVAPIVAIAVLTLTSTYSTMSIDWTIGSNFASSGGFGPNQTCTALGLGALLAFLVSIDPYSLRLIRWLMSGIALLLLTQAVMTFSRGGVYSAGIGATLACVALLSKRGRVKGRARGIVLLVLLSVTFMGAILPRLDQFTGGALEARLRNTTTSGRDELIRDDLRLWSENPLLGIGPGTSMHHRITTQRVAASHTEYTRLLAEHGIFGAFALATMVVMCLARVFTVRDSRERALVIALLSWGVVTMGHATMRTLGPSFILALAFTVFSSTNRIPGTVQNCQPLN